MNKGLDIFQCGDRSVIPCKTLEYTVSYIAHDGDVILLLPSADEQGDERTEEDGDNEHWIYDPILLSQKDLTVSAADNATISLLTKLDVPIFTFPYAPLNITKDDDKDVSTTTSTDTSSHGKVSLTFINIRFSNITLFDLAPSFIKRKQRRVIDLSLKKCELLEGFQIFIDHDIIDESITIHGDTNTTSSMNTTTTMLPDENNIHTNGSAVNDTLSPEEIRKDLLNKTNTTTIPEAGNYGDNKTIGEISSNATTLSLQNKTDSNETLQEKDTISATRLPVRSDESFHNGSSNGTLPHKDNNDETPKNYQWLNIKISDCLINVTIEINQVAEIVDRIKANLTILNSIYSAGYIISTHNAVERLHLENVIFTRSGPRSRGTIIFVNGGGINGTKTDLVLNNVTVTGHIDGWIFLHCIHCRIRSDLLIFKDLLISNGLFFSSVEASFKRIELVHIQLSWTFSIMTGKSMVNVKDIFTVRHSVFRYGPMFSVNLSSVVILKKFQGMCLVYLFFFFD